MKTKVKSHGDEVTKFYDKGIPKVDSNHTSLAVITSYFALKKDDNNYLQVFSKECKYIEKKVIRQINDDLSGFPSSDESDESDKECVKAILLILFERTILKMYRPIVIEQFQKCAFWERKFDSV